MTDDIAALSTCPEHGRPTKRAECPSCNAAYMKDYMRRRRLIAPEISLWERAFRRAKKRGIPFALSRTAISVPTNCPVLHIPIIPGRCRSPNSPSLDKIIPSRGYVPGNVRVISDRANRIKGDRDLEQLRRRAASGPVRLRDDYGKVAAYVDREALLAEVRAKAARGGRLGEEWGKVADFLEQAFENGGAFQTDGMPTTPGRQ